MNKFKNFRKSAKKQLIELAIVTTAIAAIFAFIYWPQVESRLNLSMEDKAISERLHYNRFAGSISKDNPLLGVGIGQFVPEFMNREPGMYFGLYQPVHNIYLLVLSEIGVIGAILFGLFLAITLWHFVMSLDFSKLYSYSFAIFVLSILAIGFVDHFLLTLQAGRTIFWLMLGFMAALAQLNRKSGLTDAV